MIDTIERFVKLKRSAELGKTLLRNSLTMEKLH